jgi:hypothetical protein
MTEEKQIGGQKIREAGLHMEHLNDVSCARLQNNIIIESDRFTKPRPDHPWRAAYGSQQAARPIELQ